jgi:16S rRNA (guanine966-N2)-methyltransferase
MSLRLSGGRRLQSPVGDRARPTTSRVRLAVMNMLAPRLAGCRWLDLCCGSGVMACEALLRGASQLVGVEQDRRIAAVARANLVAVSGPPGDNGWQLHCREVVTWLRQTSPADVGAAGGFDLIYLDPPYGAGLYEPATEALGQGAWLADGGLLLWECASGGLPLVPEGWSLEQQRRYGSTTVVLLTRRAGCPGDTGSRQP